MRPEFAAAFQNCMNFSCKYHLFKGIYYSGEWPRFNADEDQLEEKTDEGRIRGVKARGGVVQAGHSGVPYGCQAHQAGARRDVGVYSER